MTDTPPPDSFGDTASSTIMWFGQYAGKRFDEIDYDYRLWMVYSEEAQKFSWHKKMVELHQRCLDEKKLYMLPEELPGNRKYGWTKQQPFHVVYNTPQWMHWCETKLTRGRLWQFLDTKKQYEAWLAENQPHHQATPITDQAQVEEGQDSLEEMYTNRQTPSQPIVEHIEHSNDERSQPPSSAPPPFFDEDDWMYAEHDQPPKDSEDEHADHNEHRESSLVSNQPRSDALDIPLSGHIREAQDLFNDDAGSVKSAPRAETAARRDPSTARTGPVTPSKRHRGIQTERDSEDEGEHPSPSKRRTRPKARSDASEDVAGSGEVDVAEELSQLSLKSPKRSNRRKNVILSQSSVESVAPVAPRRSRRLIRMRELLEQKSKSEHQSPAAAPVTKQRRHKMK